MACAALCGRRWMGECLVAVYINGIGRKGGGGL